jgi:multidrug efflux pump subunit AcrA (membrane-fusion protein)
MKKSIFRKVALERLSSPEHLDRLIRITGIRSWLILAGIFLIIAFIIIWALFGEIPVTIQGQGILMKSGGIVHIQHGTQGIILDISVKPGEIISSGKVIARLNQDELAGLINETRLEYESLASEKNSTANAIGVKKRELARLEEQFLSRSNIISPYTGQVIEVYVNTGSYISPGDPVISIEPAGKGIKNLEAVIYVPSGEGKKIMPGMEAKISPSSVKKEEYGFLLGRVNTVTGFPASRRALLNTLGSEGLVDLISGEGPVMAVNVDLVTSSITPSGYVWSSAGGPKMEIQSGTLCDGVIVTRIMRPIQFLFPEIQ